MSTCTNLLIKDAACHQIVHILQHPTSRPTTKSTQTTNVNARKNNIWPLPAGRYGKLPKRSAQCPHQAKEGKSGLEADRDRALGALHRLRSTKKLEAEKRHEMHLLRNVGIENWIGDYVARQTAGAWKRVEDAEAAVHRDHEDMKHAEIAGLTNREPANNFEKIMVAFGDSLSDLASSNDSEDGEDENDEVTEQGKLSGDDAPGWVMCTITNMVQKCVERFRTKLMKLEKLNPPGREDAADYFSGRDQKCGTSNVMVLAVIQLQTDDTPAASSPTTLGELSECRDIIPRMSQMQPGTSWPGSSHIRLRSLKPHSNTSIPGLQPAAEPDWSPLLKAKPVKPVIFQPCT